MPNGENLPVLLVLNKWDRLEEGSIEQTDLELTMRELVVRHGFVGFMKTSALTGFNIRESFRTLLKELIRRGGTGLLASQDTFWNSSIVSQKPVVGSPLRRASSSLPKKKKCGC